MEKPTLVLKPSIINALFPIFVRNLLYSLVLVVILYGVYYILRFFKLVPFSNAAVIGFFISLLLVIAILPLCYELIKLVNTTYYFYHTHVSAEFALLAIKKHSVNYSQITNISTDISIWDRLSNAGDITIHTGQEQTPSLILTYISSPRRIEKIIYHLIHKNRK